MSKAENDEVDRIRMWLKTRVMSRASLREVERILGVKGGGIRQLLRGEMNLSLQHVLVLLEAVDIDPGVFFRQVYPESGRSRPPAPPLSPEGRENMETTFGQLLGKMVERRSSGGG